MSKFIPLEHPRFIKAERDIFIKSVTADCMNHRCAMVHEDHRLLLDACCQYGVDVDIGERDAILEHREEIHALLTDEAADKPWFSEREQADADFPSGKYVRTGRHAGGCVFLAHDRRGCAIHRAALENAWDFRGVKPHVCRLFPLSYESDCLVLSDDYSDYSCAQVAHAPSVYRVARTDIGDIFGVALVRALDDAEIAVLGPRSRLRVVAS